MINCFLAFKTAFFNRQNGCKIFKLSFDMCLVLQWSFGKHKITAKKKLTIEMWFQILARMAWCGLRIRQGF